MGCEPFAESPRAVNSAEFPRSVAALLAWLEANLAARRDQALVIPRDNTHDSEIQKGESFVLETRPPETRPKDIREMSEDTEA